MRGIRKSLKKINRREGREGGEMKETREIHESLMNEIFIRTKTWLTKYSSGAINCLDV